MNRITKKIGAGILVVFIMGSVAFKSDFFEIAKQIEIYTSLYKELNMYYVDEINPAELNEIAMKSMLKSLDPYTNYYDEQGIEDVRIKRSGEYGGIGSYTRYKDKRLFILEPYKDSPAAEAGLKAGDEIIQIDDVILKEFEGEGVGNMLRGTPKTEVKIKVLRQGEVLDFVVKRAKIEMNPVPFYKMIDDEVGYISFVKFNKKASKEVKKAYRDLKEQGMKKLILDIRGNPGGLLNQAVAITNFFIPKDQLVVTTKAKVKKWSTSYRTKNDPIDLEIPIVVLINGRSASASEIVSGALQDYDRAVIMGERSFGKGLVQRYRELAYGTQMKLTISKYYIPSGRCIQELDYTNKDKDGNVPKFSDGKINKFKTANGRKVYDGGGVLPDVEIEKPKTLDLTKKLLSSDAMFHFVTAYYYAHNSIAEPNQFKLEDKVYVDFMSYLRTHPDEFETASDHKLEEALDIIEKEGYKSEIETSFSSFKQEAIDAKLSQLDTNKDEIIAYLTAEIVKRYYYKEGVFKQKMAFDPVIVEAASLLNNERAYKKVLR